jgi:hypothetical protein
LTRMVPQGQEILNQAAREIPDIEALLNKEKDR